MGAVDTVEWTCVLCGCHIQNDWVEQRICIKFCVKLEHSSTETTWMIQKVAALGNWWLAASSQQHSCLTSPAQFFVKTSNHPGDLAPLQPRFGTMPLVAFLKTKITFERKQIQTLNEIQENTTGQLMVIGRTVWGLKVPTLKGTEVSLSNVQCFLYLVSSSIRVSLFHSTWLDTFWTYLAYLNSWSEWMNKQTKK